MRLATIDQLHTLTTQIIFDMQGKPAKEKKKICIDAVYELLVLAYVFGNQRATSDAPSDVLKALSDSGNLDSEGNVPIDQSDLYRALYEPIAGETFEQRISRRIDEDTLDNETLNRIVETDWHRMEETGAYQTAEFIADKTGSGLNKVWITMNDDRVRDTHWFIHGMAVPKEERFYTFDGDSARFPGDFYKAENNVNCRCEIKYTYHR